MTLTEDERHRLALKDAEDEPIENLEAAARIYDDLMADCWGCGEPAHAGPCLPRCTNCGAIASGLTEDESDPSVGLFGPGPMCLACDAKMQREYTADPTDAEQMRAKLRWDAQYGKA